MDAPVMVQNVTTIPIRVQHVNAQNYNPEPMEVSESGFPFDDTDFGRDEGSFRSHIDDLTKRHPEIAKHFNKDFDKFPFRSNTWGHKKRPTPNPSNSESSQPEDFPEFKRFTDRPFGSRFERFGFPFNRTFDGDTNFREDFPHHSGQPSPPSSSASQQQQQPQPEPQTSSSSKEPQQPAETSKSQESSDKPPYAPVQNQDRGRKQHPYVAQSNTADLGQKQDPVFEQRSQRSMSAPPENRSAQPRFVSSINIPINVQKSGGGDGMGGQQSQPKQPQNQSGNERVIPIIVEGRNEPVIPKNIHQTFATPPRPEPERVFSGARPSQFAGWTRNEPQFFKNDPYFSQQHPKPAEETMKQQHVPQQQSSSPQPQQQNRQATPPKQQEPPHQNPPAASAPPKQQAKLTPTEQIEAIQKDVADLMNQIEGFTGKSKDKQYLYLDEMLTRNLIKLDNVITDGQEELRQKRKEAIRSVQRCISILESKVSSQNTAENMEVEPKNETSEQNMEVEKAEVDKPMDESVKEESSVVNEQQTDTPSQEEVKPVEELTSLEVSGNVKSGAEVKPEEGATPMEVNTGNEENNAESNENNEKSKNEETKDKKEEKKDKKKVKKKDKTDKK